MMKVLSINKVLTHDSLSIQNIQESELSTYSNLKTYDYIIINGGDGTIRRVVKILHHTQHIASIILNPTGSFNVIAKLHRVPKLARILDALAKEKAVNIKQQPYYSINDEVFLFSAGNMGDLQHILLSESLRFGVLKYGMGKYILSVLFLLPLHLIMTPFMLFSKSRFFIFTPASFIGKLGSFYGRVESTIEIDLNNNYNHLELDGDIVTMKESVLAIRPEGVIKIVIP